MPSDQKFALADETQKLATLRTKRRDLSGAFSGLEKMTQDALKTGQGTAKTKARIDQGLQGYKEYSQSVGELVVGMQDQLDEYMAFTENFRNYQGLEKLVQFFSKGKANSMRHRRMASQTPKENLKLFLTYGMQVFDELCEIRQEAIRGYEELNTTVETLVNKIAEYQPQEQEQKEQLEAMTKAYREKQSAFKTADPAQQARLLEAINADHEKLVVAQNRYDQVLTVYSQAQQALQSNMESRDAFDQMIRDLGRQATMVKEKIENVTAIYNNAPQAIKIMMGTKGMSAFDSATNVATEKSVQLILDSAAAVTDETLRREETQLISAEEMANFLRVAEERNQRFIEGYTRVQENARKSQAERYGATR